MRTLSSNSKPSKMGRVFQYLLLSIPILVIAVLCWTDYVARDNLLYTIDWQYPLSFLETNYAYIYVHLFTIIPVFLLSFDKKVAFYKKWKYLFPAIFLVGVLFIIADVYFTKIGVWGFNPKYSSSLKLFHLPIEEWLFFLTVPYACVFIYECLNHYIQKDVLANWDKAISISLSIIFFIIGIVNLDKLYTSTTFLSAGTFIAYHFVTQKNNYRTRFYLAYIVSLAPFFIVNGILTGGYTQEPIVLYNPEEYLGIRITSVPIDDSVYSFLLLFMVTSIYEYCKLFSARSTSP